MRIIILLILLLVNNVSQAVAPIHIERGHTEISVFEVQDQGLALVETYSSDDTHFKWGRFYPNPYDQEGYVALDEATDSKLVWREVTKDNMKQVIFDLQTKETKILNYTPNGWEVAESNDPTPGLVEYLTYIKDLK